ncbi:hydroxyjasmonate sulfotransferase [Salvia divinorum]|uniref:Sulfotransferase n=1 Tax=Salvia divinorum TaxID=28513 RepID=A0ABD1IIJ4_SALDI
MSSPNPKYLQQEESLTLESKELISTLPRHNGWFDSTHLYLYRGFWYQPDHLQAVISCQNHFQPRHSDVFLATYPKCGTTWLKAIIFTILNRKHFPPASQNHPLLTTNPHQLVLSLEIDLYAANQLPTASASAASSSPSRRFFSTHMPHASLPLPDSQCKVVYACRNAKDTFVSLWHFMNKLRPQGAPEMDMETAFQMFCDGAVGYGPFWDHVLGYWRRSRKEPERVLFVRYEDMKEEAAVQVRRLAEFLECGFSAAEEEEGVVDRILDLTSFESMRGSEVNRVGRLGNGIENKHFFREGVVGDWKNCLSAQMAQKLDRIVEEKFAGTGLFI